MPDPGIGIALKTANCFLQNTRHRGKRRSEIAVGELSKPPVVEKNWASYSSRQFSGRTQEARLNHAVVCAKWRGRNRMEP